MRHPPDDDSSHRLDGSDGAESVVRRVVAAVAAVRGDRPMDLPPLGDAVDPDALEALFPPCGTGSRSVVFEYAGTRVQISGSGDVCVAPLDGDDQ